MLQSGKDAVSDVSVCRAYRSASHGSGSWLMRRTAEIAAAAGVTGGDTDMATGLPTSSTVRNPVLATGIGSGLQHHVPMSSGRMDADYRQIDTHILPKRGFR